jgi:hypothetical protein
MSLKMAIEAVEAEALRKQNAKLAMLAGSSLRANASLAPGSPVRQNSTRDPLATLWARFRRRADDGAPGRDANPAHGIDSKGHTWLTELLDSASRGLDNEKPDFTPKWMPAPSGNTKRQRAKSGGVPSNARKPMAGAVTRNRLDVMSARWFGYTFPVISAGISRRGCSIERKVQLMEEIISLQRATVDEHIGQENAHNRLVAYDTFAPHECAIDVVPFHAQFGGLNGIKDFIRP